MVETRIQENAMEARMQNVEQRLHSVDELQETVLGFRNEIQIMGRTFRQEMQAIALEIQNIAHGPLSEKPMTELTYLRQTGTLAKFNVKFDTISAKLDLPEGYLVVIYVGALKEEIADSVRLFNPRTMLEARRMARVQEISLLWQSKKKIVLPSVQETRIMEERVQILEQPMIENRALRGAVKERCEGVRVMATTTHNVARRLEETHLRQRELLAQFNVEFDQISSKLDFPKEYLLDAYTSALKLKLKASIQMSDPRTMVEAWRFARLQELVITRQNPRNTVDKSEGYVSTSTLVVTIPLVPLSSFSPPLSLFQSLDQRTLQNEDNAQISENTEQLA